MLLFYLLRGIKATFTPLQTLASANIGRANSTLPSCFLVRQAAPGNKNLDIYQEFLKV